MSNYRIKITTTAKQFLGCDYNPDQLVYIVQRKFWGFLWHDVCQGYSEMWARHVIEQRKQLDARRADAVKQPDRYIEV